jgi:hypothetical protein
MKKQVKDTFLTIIKESPHMPIVVVVVAAAAVVVVVAISNR